jgi:hypothetical protein
MIFVKTKSRWCKNFKVALDFDKAVSGGEDPVKVLLDMKKRTGCYVQRFLHCREKILQSEIHPGDLWQGTLG